MTTENLEPELVVEDVAERSWMKRLGPGLITGAADDDPSGIATYSQAGANSASRLLWTSLITYPLMVGSSWYARAWDGCRAAARDQSAPVLPRRGFCIGGRLLLRPIRSISPPISRQWARPPNC